MVEGARLEIVWALAGLEGSNPFASATAPEAVFLRIRSANRILSFATAPEAVFLISEVLKKIAGLL